MLNSIKKYLGGIASEKDAAALTPLFKATGNALATQPLRTAGLLCTATAGKKVPKIGSAAYYGSVKGRIVTIAASADMPALSGTVAADAFNVYCFFIDSASTVTSVMGTAGASIGLVKFPAFPVDKALVGFIIVNPTGTGDFVGNTSDLEDATIVPNTVYVSPVGAFDPTFLFS